MQDSGYINLFIQEVWLTNSIIIKLWLLLVVDVYYDYS